MCIRDRATTAAAAGTDAATTAGTSEGGKTLIYWSMWSSTEPQAKVIQEAAAAYEAKTGNKIQIEWKGRDINKVIQTALEANTQIDLFDEDFQRVGEQYASLCMDLEEMAKAANYEETVVCLLYTSAAGSCGRQRFFFCTGIRRGAERDKFFAFDRDDRAGQREILP